VFRSECLKFFVLQELSAVTTILPPQCESNVLAQQDQARNFGAMMQMITGYWVSASIYAVTRLGIPDLLEMGPLGYEDLARRTEANADYLYRVLRALCGVGIFHELPEKVFEQTPLSRMLACDTPGSMRGIALMMGEEHYQVWGRLYKTLKAGDSAFESVYGMPVFEYFEKKPQSGEIFNQAMTSFASGMHRAALGVYDFSRFNTIVDVGGGHGALLTGILRQCPSVQGILFDLPHVVSDANIPADLASRLSKAPGDFFREVHPGADAYVLSTVIHDWSDDLALKILRNIHAAMPEHGTLLLLENMVEADNQPSPAKFLDINMLLMTEGGRERSSAEYRKLFADAGFELTHIVPTPSRICVLEGRKR
jgi:hypothetical protein